MNKFIIFVLLCLTTLVNCNYRHQPIKNAYKITRPLNIPYVPKTIIHKLDRIGINHQAVKITVPHLDGQKQYIISNNPKNGIHVTDANLSNKWRVDREIPINGDKKIGEVLTGANGVGNGITSYVSTGTCIGTTKAIEKQLAK